MAFLAPSSHGWRARVTTATGTQAHEFPTFAEAVVALPPDLAGDIVTLALPTRLVIFERFTLPSRDPSELADMVRLQLEKTLPYPVEETTHHFQVLSQSSREATTMTTTTEGDAAAPLPESTVIVAAIHNPAVEAFCAPLSLRARFPEQLGLLAMQIAGQASPEEVTCGLWQEEGRVVIAVFEKGKLSFAEVIDSHCTLLNDFPQVLMSAELAGAPTEFGAILLDPSLGEFRDSIAEFLKAPIHDLKSDTLPTEVPVDFALDAWKAELGRHERFRKLKVRLAAAGLAYAALLLMGFAYLGVLGHRLHKLEGELDIVRPQVDTIIAQKGRWKTLSAGIDQRRFTVELLYQVFQSLPSPDVRITQFDESPTQFMVEGEAPDAGQAIEVGEKLKGQEELSEFTFDAGPPAILPNDHAQFRIFGKL